ncbi:MAG: VWA domain-containing protein, partial [Candidatus Woesearchaeota archaeon]
SALEKEDLKVFEKRKKGKLEIIYALDSSGSMKGEKIKTAKKAGVALAYKAINEKNKVGLIIFESEIKKEIFPTHDFGILLEELTKIRAGKETDIAVVLRKAAEMFSKTRITKHLIILSDALPTKGKNPEEDTLKAASIARNFGITISMVGINFDDQGLKLAQRIVEIGEGRLYACKDLGELDKIVLGDYYSL